MARGVRTRAGLRKIAAELPAETQVHLKYKIRRAIPRREAAALAAELRRRLVFPSKEGRGAGGGRRKYPTVAVGSLRRGAARVKDIDILVVAARAAQIPGLLSGGSLAPGRGAKLVATYASGPRRRSVVVSRQAGGELRYYAVDLFLATRAERPYALLAHTGPRDYNIALRAHAKRRGLRLNQYGLFRADGARVPISPATERRVVEALGVAYRRPADRAQKKTAARDYPRG